MEKLSCRPVTPLYLKGSLILAKFIDEIKLGGKYKNWIDRRDKGLERSRRERERERVDNYFSRSKSLLFKNLFVVERNPGGPPNPSPALIIVEWFRCSR